MKKAFNELTFNLWKEDQPVVIGLCYELAESLVLKSDGCSVLEWEGTTEYNLKDNWILTTNW